MVSVLFNLLDEPEGTEFFARMCLASHGPERDTGHTGNFFNMLWAMPGVAQSSPGRGWNNKDRNGFYDALSGDQLLERLGSWSPIERERAAMALGRRKNAPVAALIEMLSAPTLEVRYGACQGLIHLRGQAAPAVEALQETLAHQDLWLRIKAVEALASIGKSALPALPDILDRIAHAPDDPRAMEQRYICAAVFEKMLTDARKLEGVDREKLRVAIARPELKQLK